MKEDTARVLSILGGDALRESELCERTGWDRERLLTVLAAMQLSVQAKRAKHGGSADSHWIAADTVIAKCVWSEADVLRAVAAGDFATRGLQQQSGGAYEPLRLLLARMKRDGKIKRVTYDGIRKWVLSSRKVALSGKKPYLRNDRLLSLIAKHQPIKLEVLAEMVGWGRFAVRRRVGLLRERGLVKYDVLGDAWRYVLSDYQRPAEDTGREILLRCKDVGGDCLTWEGAHNPQGHALVRHGDNVARVDMVLWQVVHGKELKPGHTLMRTCETPGCCHHGHHKQATRSEAMRAAFAANGFGGAVHGRKVSQALRPQRGVLTPEEVHLVRTSDKTGGQLAKELGRGKSVVSAARRHQTYRDYSNPFAGLGAR
ncbi:hypothetical protein HNP48_002277 [Acidovorax soli]|uniref:Uncharacterized protein n=1 Tax=Acidovorax soli TaxID=592050 RepID=A0A7X0PCY2_9BURK|nr:hypothetical protein [Acidovorax soli]MBB6559610.1 hypothetical protein [Acidovorax soli]